MPHFTGCSEKQLQFTASRIKGMLRSICGGDEPQRYGAGQRTNRASIEESPVHRPDPQRLLVLRSTVLARTLAAASSGSTLMSSGDYRLREVHEPYTSSTRTTRERGRGLIRRAALSTDLAQ